MIQFINKFTGTVMRVSDDRAEEYKAAGHKLAAVPDTEKPAKKQPVDKKGKMKK